MKKIFFSLLGLGTIAIPIVTSVSCATISQQQKNVDIIIDTKMDEGYTDLRKYTYNEWVSFIKEFCDQGNNEQISELFALIQKKDSTFIPDGTIEFLDVRKNYQSEFPTTIVNLELKIKNNDSIFNVDINNLFIFASSHFKAPTKYNYEFEQVNLSSIANESYKNINDAEWTNAFNATDKVNFVIPKNIYVITSKKLEGNKLTFTYTVDNAYIEQINSLSNKEAFKDITVVVTLSPFIDKKPQYSFKLNNEQSKSIFGNDATIDTVNAMTELDIYNKLVEYVRTLENIQPIRNCIDPNDPNKIFGFDKRKVIISNSINATLIIKFKTSDTSQKTIEYQFELEFKIS